MGRSAGTHEGYVEGDEGPVYVRDTVPMWLKLDDNPRGAHRIIEWGKPWDVGLGDQG